MKTMKLTKTPKPKPQVAKTMKIKPINTRWFKDRIATKQLSQRKLAAALHLDPAALSLMLRGMREVKNEEAAALARELGVPIADVLEQLGIDMTAGAASQVSVLGKVESDGRIRMTRPVDGPRRVPAPEGMPDDAAAIRYEGEGFTDGWVAYYRPAADVDVDAIGRLCVAHLAGKNEWYLRVVRRGYAKGTYSLCDPLGKAGDIDGARLASAAPVLWVRTGA